MSERVLAALKVGPATTELREMPLPEIAPDAALLKVEVAGVCGTDVHQYPLPLRGAPVIMGVEREDALTRIRELTGGRSVDVAIDCTGAGTSTMLLALEAKRRGATMVVQADGNATFPDFPIGRNHAEERARPFVPLRRPGAAAPGIGAVPARELMTTHRFGLSEVDHAITSVAGQGAPGAIHVSVMPWK